MALIPWWKRLPARLLSEEQMLLEYEARIPDVLKRHQWVKDADGEPQLRAWIEVDNKLVELKAVFPHHYPEGCPTVYPVPFTVVTSSHQFTKTGAFCLELGPDNWHPKNFVAELLFSTWKLLTMEEIRNIAPDREIPSRHQFTLRDRLHSVGLSLVHSASFDERLGATNTSGTFEYSISKRNPLRIVPREFPTGNILPDIPPGLKRGTAAEGQFICLNGGSPNVVPTGRTQFNEFIQKHGNLSIAESKSAVFLLKWSDDDIRGFLCSGEDVAQLVDFPLQEDSTRRVPTNVTASLERARVGIIGLGSLGSKVAVTLARTGVRRFVLVDDDILEGGNVCRHAASFADVGAAKPRAVKELIRDVSVVEPEVTLYAIGLGTATNPSLHATIVETLGDCDVLIDTTGNPEVFGIVAMIASDHKRAMVWGEVFGGGLGGLIASAHPEIGPCPRCIRSGILARSSEWPPAPAGIHTVPYGGGESQPLVASDADVAFIASALAKRVLDVSVCDTAGYADVVILGLRPGWIFDTAFQSKDVNIRRDDFSCPRCWSVEADANNEIVKEAETLFSKSDVDHIPPP